MKKFLTTLGVGAAVFAVAAPAQAAQSINISGPSGTFGNDSVTCDGSAPCSFTNLFNFVTPEGFSLVSATISSIMTGNNQPTNIDFSSVTLNGMEFAIASTGDVEFRSLLDQAVSPGGNNTLSVNGTSGGAASYSGTLSFAQMAAVPEPATWAMMLLGFGAVGFSMRRRQKGYRYAQAV